MNDPKLVKIVIIGAGPAGLSLAYRLLRRHDIKVNVTLIEKEDAIGGLCSGFTYRGLNFDYGSHRLHPATSEEIFAEIRSLLGADLRDRPRNGRIRLLSRYVKFPLKLLDFTFKLPLSFFFGIIGDMVAKPFLKNKADHETYETILMRGLGKTICTNFYFPYARKLWGLDPDRISAVQARRRVAAGSIGKIIRKVLSVIPIFKQKGAGRFFYPCEGFVQIFNRYAEEIEKAGGTILRSDALNRIDLDRKTVITSSGKTIGYDLLFSTIPIHDFLSSLSTVPPHEVRDAASHLGYRGMIFCYFVYNTSKLTPYDAHYFPESELRFSRLSEPKNYALASDPAALTGICIEIPCEVGGELWNADEKTVIATARADLDASELGIEGEPVESFTRRTAFAYPTYSIGFEPHWEAIDSFQSALPNIVVLGRQALYAHDNTHHTIDMGYRAAECINADGSWDATRWALFREEFKNHVVED
jgi:protoporphyrinogen oxidase